jgi:predicted dehydrogenase
MLDLAPVMLFTGTEHELKTTEFRDLDADWAAGFIRSSQHFVDSLLHGTPADMTPEAAIKVLQLCFAVYQASEIGTSVDPRTMTGSVTPTGWADW